MVSLIVVFLVTTLDTYLALDNVFKRYSNTAVRIQYSCIAYGVCANVSLSFKSIFSDWFFVHAFDITVVYISFVQTFLDTFN